MSELINHTDRINQLYGYVHRLIDGDNGKTLIDEYKSYIDTVTPAETMQVLDKLIINGYSTEVVKNNVGKIINIFFKSLNACKWEKPLERHFLFYLMQENREVERIMTEIKTITRPLLKEKTGNQELYQKLLALIEKLEDYDLHYIKKENILFPYIEKTFPQFRCLQLMWSFHDDYRNSLKKLKNILKAEVNNTNDLNIELGKLFFVVLPIIFREEQIVFPVAFRSIPEKLWDEMLEQSFEQGWCYGVKPEKKIKEQGDTAYMNGLINLNTGFLKADQLILMLEHLPVDITFVDKNDEVRYFSGAKHRIFPRSKAIIGRKVQNCHPPESVHIVNEIVHAFRSGTKDHADFWIQMKGRFIHIRYFALRDEQGIYRGTIEVSQDVTEIRELEGEKRLLNWQ